MHYDSSPLCSPLLVSFRADVATALLSEILTNNASGAIMYPIAAIAGDKLKIEVIGARLAHILKYLYSKIPLYRVLRTTHNSL